MKTTTLTIETPVQCGPLTVYTNGSGEIFIRNTISQVTMRISPVGESMHVTAAAYCISPTSSNGLDAFRVSKP